MSVTEKLATYIVNATFEDIPPEAVEKTKELILDDIGNAIGGSVLKSGEIIIQWAKNISGVPESTIISDGIKVPAGIASGVNTQLSMANDFMETYKNRGHPGSAMVMTALAMGERQKASGKDLITAICAAYDVTGRIIDATDPTPDFRRKVWNENWHCCGSLFVAMKLLRLNLQKAKNAMGMGLGNAPTTNVHNILNVPASMSKCGNQFHSFVGINAAILADLGYTGYYEILDGPYSYWTTISDMNRKDLYTKDLGNDFYITSGMAFKPWSTCRWAQPGIESLLDIMEKEKLNPLDIDEVVYHAHEKITNYPYDNIHPENPEDAYWSVPWALGNAALGYVPGPAWYIDDRFNDEKLKAITTYQYRIIEETTNSERIL